MLKKVNISSDNRDWRRLTLREYGALTPEVGFAARAA